MIDHSTTNPGLHALHVRWAYETLSVATQARDELMAQSKVSATIIADRINTAIREAISEDTAFRDAAALLLTHSQPETSDEE